MFAHTNVGLEGEDVCVMVEGGTLYAIDAGGIIAAELSAADRAHLAEVLQRPGEPRSRRDDSLLPRHVRPSVLSRIIAAAGRRISACLSRLHAWPHRRPSDSAPPPPGAMRPRLPGIAAEVEKLAGALLGRFLPNFGRGESSGRISKGGGR